MNKEFKFETYLNISPKKITIYLFDKKNFQNLFKEEIELKQNNDELNFDILMKFLEENIFKIEKLIGKFIKNIILIVESKKINSFKIGIKKKGYQEIIDKKFIENTITELKDIFKNSYQKYKIMHININKYLVDGKNYLFFKEDIKGNDLCLEVEFISIETSLSIELENIFAKYQIKIIQYLDENYILRHFMGENLNITEMAYKIQNGHNINEVSLVQKNPKKIGFFEKFFQLFS